MLQNLLEAADQVNVFVKNAGQAILPDSTSQRLADDAPVRLELILGRVMSKAVETETEK